MEIESIIDNTLSNDNLHPKYKLIGNDISVFKENVNSMAPKELFKLIPTVTINTNAIFYSNDKLDKKDEIGSLPPAKEDVYKYTFDINLPDSKKDVVHVYYNKKDIKVLDFTEVSVVTGFNILHFNLNGDTFDIEEKVLYEYCKRNKLDGYITLDVSNKNKNCYVQVEYDENVTVCPVVNLVNVDGYGIDKIVLVGLIGLDRKKALSYEELLKLNNLLFCNMNTLFNVNINIKTIPSITTNNLYHTVHFTYNDKEYSLDDIYKNKNILTILDLNYTNLEDECGFQFYDDNMTEEEIDVLPQNVDLFTNKKIDVSVADKLVDAIFTVIATQNDIDPFLMNNYAVLGEIDGYENLVQLVEDAKSIDRIKEVFTYLEKDIVTKIKDNYEKSDINFGNLEFLPSTYQYIISNVTSAVLKNDIEEVINIINGVELKQYNFMKYFKADLLLIDIGYKKYNTYKKLYQGLLDDVTKYQKNPSIDLELIKYLSKINEDGRYKELKNVVYPDIYDGYKQFIKGNITFDKLYNFLGVDNIYNYIYYFANNNDIQPNILLLYNDIINLPMMKGIKKNIYQMSMESFKEYLDDMIIDMFIAKIVTDVAKDLKLDISLGNVKRFLNEVVKKYVDEQIQNSNSEINAMIKNPNTDFYAFLTKDINTNDIIKYLSAINSNDVMLDKIYDYLGLKIKNKDDVLKLLRNKNLYNIFLSHLQHQISKDELKKQVYFTFEEEKKPRRSSNSKREKEQKKTKKSKEPTEEELEEEEELTEEM